ncbi:GNAT family N-acetyltransferase [Mucilaginibacter sp. RCC_168]|uniref:GNAT family N-acetyltransferase n=1 Tax=Mucilaginibacter sp. RCC_168 TaxID=3239221 RepID=UPI003526684C
MVNKESIDKERIIKILTDAFEYNKSINYIVKQDSRKKDRIRSLMEYSVAVCELFGEVYLTDDKNACALLLYPQLKKTTLKTILLDIKLIFKSIGITGIGKTLSRESKIKSIQPKEAMSYLWFIGTDPNAQNKGIGTKLMQQIISVSNEKKLPLYLETSTVENLKWYNNFQFEIYDELQLDYKLFFLKRKPDNF